jgi:iron complex transport system substrate-binding protein
MAKIRDLRIVSLLPSATEIIDCLGLTSALVGRSHECDYPPEVQNLPICTTAKLNSNNQSAEIDRDVQSLLQQALSIYRVEIATLERLQPTHIVTQDQCDVCAVNFAEVTKAVAQLTQSSPQIISLQPNLLDEVWQDIIKVGKVLGVDSQSTISGLKERINNISERLQESNKIPTVVAIEWIEPLMTAGNWIPELIEIAGGESLLGSKGKHSPYISWDELIAADPDIIIIMPCGFDLARTAQEAETLKTNSQWRELKAVRDRQVYLVDGNAYFNRPGPRLVDSTEILASILHPRLFDFNYQNNGWQKFT